MLIKQFSRFIVVGSLGFVVDAGILYLLNGLMGYSPVLSRVPSFSVAVVITWWFNRQYTFDAKDSCAKQTLLKYISVNLIGLCINFGVYSLAVIKTPFFAGNPILALALASIAGMAFNFTTSKFFVFDDKKEPL